MLFHFLMNYTDRMPLIIYCNYCVYSLIIHIIIVYIFTSPILQGGILVVYKIICEGNWYILLKATGQFCRGKLVHFALGSLGAENGYKKGTFEGN